MDTIRNDGRRNWGWIRTLGWGGAVALIVMPLVAMQVAPDSGVDWTGGDFIFAIVMFAVLGLAFEAAVRISANWSYRLGAALGLGTGFLLVWANLAVGYIGSEDNPYNQIFFGVVLVGIAGSVLVRFRARGMAVAMLVTAIVHSIAGAAGFPQDTRTAPFTAFFTLLWLASAALFRSAAKAERQPAV